MTVSGGYVIGNPPMAIIAAVRFVGVPE